MKKHQFHDFSVSSSNPKIHIETDRNDHDACFFHGLLISLCSERLAKIDEKASTKIDAKAVNSNDYTCSIREHWSYREVGCV